MASLPALEPSRLCEDVACCLCGSQEREEMHRRDPFRIVRCTGCSLVYTVPRLSGDDLHELYQEAYWQSDSAKDYGYTDYVADAELYRKTFRLRSRILKRHRPPPARVLDVGCAAGFALEVLRDLGYDTYGLEISRPMAERAAGVLGADRVHHGPLTSGVFGGGFDLMTMWDVVEHVEDPIEFLRTARSLLKEDGLLVLETQNVRSWFARLLGIRWQHYKFHEHLHHFDPHTIVKLLDAAGFERVDWTARYGGKYVSCGFLVERVGRVHPVLSVLASPLKLFKRRSLYLNVFDEMLVVARPKRAADG